jgi:hypothetical protein
MQTLENKKILNYLLVGVLIWLTIKSFAIIIKQISTFVLIQVELNEATIFYSTQLVILLSVFLLTRMVLVEILTRLNESKFIIIRIVVIYVIMEILKHVSYMTTPILVGQSGITSINYFTALKENVLFKTIQFITEYAKIVLVGLTIFFHPRLKEKKMIEA